MIPDDYSYMQVALAIASQRNHGGQQELASGALDCLLSEDPSENVLGLMMAAQLRCFAPA